MKISSIRRNVFYSGITNFSDMMLFVLLILAGRFLGAQDFGTFSFALSLATLFLTFANFGLTGLAIRDVARDRVLASYYLGNILLWQGILSLLAFISLVITVFYLLEADRNTWLVVSLLGIAMGLRVFLLTGRAFLQALEQFDTEALFVLIQQIVLLMSGAVFLLLGYGVIGLAFAFLFTRLMGCLFLFSLLRRGIPFSLQFNLYFILNLQRQAIPLGIAFLVTMSYLHIDTLLLSYFRTHTDVGLYNAALKIYTGLFLLPSIASSILLPRLSSIYLKDKEHHLLLLIRGLFYVLLISLPISISGILFSKTIIVQIFGEEFISSIRPMQILFGIVIITFQNSLLRTVLISMNGQQALMIFNIFTLGTRIVFSALFIPYYGISGTAIATGVSELLLYFSIWIYLSQKYFGLKSLGEPGKLFKKISCVYHEFRNA